ncbi:adenylyl-sulfate kinase [Streptosporangium roseum]|uniref:Adenylyl-sulfate kinase n=1 Tax=Streptosporangium roseum (strain ATCC 12428 / DSM 43021 / JCM 3005 / KCTC 9067 / NCIMB 10171 / NRRL 2505 / NI 9100) TaxID=479432 RepID=D2B3Z5_STRRD|nr:adenylyl-sulfate kinase [Streptosporangium roseum]ACZ91229.1 Adenylylsulfate kinase and related kinase-like protein [Streptosporangium roseum DSM 43021]
MTAPFEWTPDARELADLELLLSGAFQPLTGFLTSADAHAVDEHGTLADGTPWPAPVTLALPDDHPAAPGDRITLRDPEGAALAVLTVTERADGAVAGPLETLDTPEHGPFARLRRTPAEVRKELSGREVLAVTMRGPLDDLEEIRATAEELDAAILLLPLAFGEAGPAVVRAALKARDRLPEGTLVAVVPLAPRHEPSIDLELREHVAEAYGATEHLAGPEPVTLPGPPHRRGLVVFFTGLSGSGKSTVARGLRDALLERGSRTITYLDGDVVRHLLSAGLSFSKKDRDLNIRRIGFVAAEAARHGGLAICAPIAPYAATRDEVRAMVEAVGADFLLVHVATPLAECERRDRKGLYAKARAGLIPEFTGVSDPYEEPDDADLVVDTTSISVDRAVQQVLDPLVQGGWVR